MKAAQPNPRRRRGTPSLPMNGFSLTEPLVLVLMLTVAMLAAAVIFSSAMRSFTTSLKVTRMETAIDQNMAQINQLSREFTCCSGTCTTTRPTSTTSGPTLPCATSDPRDDRYYFPQLDLSTTTNFANTTTSVEPAAVDQICSEPNNTNFMTPFKTAVDATAQPSPAIRSTLIKSAPLHTLEVTFSESANNTTRVIRTVIVVPEMANYCP